MAFGDIYGEKEMKLCAIAQLISFLINEFELINVVLNRFVELVALKCKL